MEQCFMPRTSALIFLTFRTSISNDSETRRPADQRIFSIDGKRGDRGFFATGKVAEFPMYLFFLCSYIIGTMST